MTKCRLITAILVVVVVGSISSLVGGVTLAQRRKNLCSWRCTSDCRREIHGGRSIEGCEEHCLKVAKTCRDCGNLGRRCVSCVNGYSLHTSTSGVIYCGRLVPGNGPTNAKTFTPPSSTHVAIASSTTAGIKTTKSASTAAPTPSTMTTGTKLITTITTSLNPTSTAQTTGIGAITTVTTTTLSPPDTIYSNCSTINNTETTYYEVTTTQSTPTTDKMGSSRVIKALAVGNGDLYVLFATISNDSDIVGVYRIYNASTFQLLRYIMIPGPYGQSQPYFNGLTLDSTCSFLYVSDFSNSYVYRVNLQQPTTITKWPVASKPYGLSVNGLQNVLVASTGSSVIQEFTPCGSLVREISDNYPVYSVVEVPDDLLAIARQGPKAGVAVISINGTELYYNSSFFSLSLASDSNGFIFVADVYSDQVLVLDPTLSEVRALSLPAGVTGSVRSPQALWLDESQGLLYAALLCDGKTCVIVFDVSNITAVFTA